MVVDASRLQEALEKSGNHSLLDFWGTTADRHLKKITSQLEAFAREYKRRFKDVPDFFGLLDTNTAKAAAFFQADTLLASREMKIMIWRILVGCEIKQIELKYKAGSGLFLQMKLGSPTGEDETYTTRETSDCRV